MNEHAQQWAEALRSGEFERGGGQLRRHDGRYCCLGVACEVYRRVTGDGEWDGVEFVVGGKAERHYLPPTIERWLGLYDHQGTYVEGGPEEHRSLARDNDSGATFAAIADRIEAEQSGGLLFAEQPS